MVSPPLEHGLPSAVTRLTGIRSFSRSGLPELGDAGRLAGSTRRAAGAAGVYSAHQNEACSL